MIYLLTFLIGFIVFLVAFKNQRKLPPGPSWSLPLFGHLIQLGALPERKLLEWSAKFGPVMTVYLGRLPVIVLSEAKIIKDAFNLPTLADRPHIEILDEYFGRKGIFFTDATTSKEQRPFLAATLKQFGIGKASLEPVIQEQVSLVIDTLAADLQTSLKTKEPITLSQRFNGGPLNALWTVVMKQDTDRKGHEVKELLAIVESFVQTEGFLIELAFYMPWLSRLFPSLRQNFKTTKENLDKVGKLAQSQINAHAQTRIPGQPRDLTDAYLDKVEMTTDPRSTFHPSRGFQRAVTNDLAFATVNDVSTALQWIFIYLIHHPKIQEKLYQEIVSVTGNNRPSCLADRHDLPLVDAVIHETLRLQPNAPLSLLHMTTEEVTLANYELPKGTAVMSNLHAVHCDPLKWENACEFMPERFLDGQGKFKVRDDWMPFGVGRRGCLGQEFSMTHLFLYTANLVQRFKFEKCGQLPSLIPIPGIGYAAQEYFTTVIDRNETN